MKHAWAFQIRNIMAAASYKPPIFNRTAGLGEKFIGLFGHDSSTNWLKTGKEKGWALVTAAEDAALPA